MRLTAWVVLYLLGRSEALPAETTHLSFEPFCALTNMAPPFHRRSYGDGTGVPPVNHAQDARATFKLHYYWLIRKAILVLVRKCRILFLGDPNIMNEVAWP